MSIKSEHIEATAHTASQIAARTLWRSRATRCLSGADERQIWHNLVGFFFTLSAWQSKNETLVTECGQ